MVDLLVSVHVTIPFDPSLHGRAVQVLDVVIYDKKLALLGLAVRFLTLENFYSIFNSICRFQRRIYHSVSCLGTGLRLK